jgi:2-beta-glucuronyltransferase
MPDRIVLLSSHYLLSKRKAGFHWLAQAFHRGGCEVTFVTMLMSPFSRLSGDYRRKLIGRAEHNRGCQ